MPIKQDYHIQGLNTKNFNYVAGLLLCPLKKVCSNIANQIGISWDKLYSDFKKSVKSIDETQADLKSMAQKEFAEKETYLILDDTQINKIYAEQIEGIEVGFDGSTGRTALGIKMVTALLTDAQTHIPINTVQYVGKDLAKAEYKTKTQIGMNIITDLFGTISITRLLADAHYATKAMLPFLKGLKVSYLMKMTRNRIVTINGKIGKLQDLLRLKKNSRIQSTVGIFGGIECVFYVAKVSNGSTVYFISNDQIEHSQLIKLYKIRWNIELFHRTAKQYLGFSDCQMRASEKQRQHMLFVMQAYAFASMQASKINLKCVEDYINRLRIAKHPTLYSSIDSSNQNLGPYA